MGDELTQYYFHWMSFYKEHSLLWKQAAKMQYEMVGILKRAEEEYETRLREAHARADSRRKLLRRIIELVDPVVHEPGDCEDCDVVREVMKELGDE